MLLVVSGRLYDVCFSSCVVFVACVSLFVARCFWPWCYV